MAGVVTMGDPATESYRQNECMQMGVYVAASAGLQATRHADTVYYS